MKKIGGPIDRSLKYRRIIGRLTNAGERRINPLENILAEKHFIPVFGLPVRIIFVLIVFLCKPLAQLASAAAVQHRLVPVLAKVFGDIVAVDVEIDNNNSLTEGHGRKGQQQDKGCTLLEHGKDPGDFCEVRSKLSPNYHPHQILRYEKIATAPFRHPCHGGL